MDQYSLIITPEKYNHIISNEHLYISASDHVIKRIIEDHFKKTKSYVTIEVGCGPARILPIMATIPNIQLTAVDTDPDFLSHAKKIIQKEKLSAVLAQADIATYRHGKPVDVFYSQGVHHHIKKGKEVQKYLKNVFSQLKEGGIYVVGDEFLPEYKNRVDRRVKIVVWYSHIISSAKKNHYSYLAQEEAKTLLDDLNENEKEENIKDEKQIQLVLETVDAINAAAIKGDMAKAHTLAEHFLNKFKHLQNKETHGDPTVDLSRGDYKICDSEFRKEVEAAGFKVKKVESIGPIATIGAMSVYVLQK